MENGKSKRRQMLGVVDLAILNMENKYWNKALDKAVKDQYGKNRVKKSLKYWRILSYPVEAFLTVIEVKIRVSGNEERILKDVEKLYAIKKSNPKCLTYMVIADRCAPERILHNIRKYATKNKVELYAKISAS